MPMKGGKWVPWYKVEAEQKAVAEAEAAVEAENPEEPKPRRQRRSQQTLEAAIAAISDQEVKLAPEGDEPTEETTE